MKNHFHKIAALILGAWLAAFASWASADPPARVGFLGDIAGSVSFSPAGENEWVQANINRPLIAGDRLWADSGARAEIQAGAAILRVSGRTEVAVLNLNDNVFQVQLAQGTAILHVRGMDQNDVLEIDTPNLAFSVRQPGDYRVDVDAENDATTITARLGRAEVYGEDMAYTIDAQKSYRFLATGLRAVAALALPPPDDFDRWSAHRDRRLDRSQAARYVSPDVVGYQDLDNNGTWQNDPEYGNVWMPNNVAAGWTPYQDGHWAWIEPWGWTWVDDAPWGFAVTHYGRWAEFHGRWGWVPGPRHERAVYAPALVAFVGGDNFQVEMSGGSQAGIGWFPLGPREVYHPAYEVSDHYLSRINTSNTVINNSQITNMRNTTNISNVTYLNQHVPGAVTAMPATAFTGSQPVRKFGARVPQETWEHAQVMPLAKVAPAHASVMGATAPGNRPPIVVQARPLAVRTAPAATPVGFKDREHLFGANPGKPLEPSALATLHPAAPNEAARPLTVAPANSLRPTTTPPVQHGNPEQHFRQPAAPSFERNAAPTTTAPREQAGGGGQQGNAPRVNEQRQREAPQRREEPQQTEDKQKDRH
jgi:hypothetical protein